MQIGLCIEMVYTTMPFEKRLQKAADLGFNKVEMWLVDRSYRGTAGQLARIAEAEGISITNTVIGSPDGSTGGGLTDPRRRAEWLERAGMSIEFNSQAGIPSTIVCTGNNVPGMSEDRMAASVIEGLRSTVDIAEGAGVTLLLEPLNTAYDHRGYWLSSSDRGAEICREVDSKRLKLLYDCYHMQIMEGDLANHIKRNLDVIGHFHCAGVPGRHEPYQGEIKYAFLASKVEEMGYEGVFGLEYSPTIDHDESLRRALDYFKHARPPDPDEEAWR